MRYYNNSKTPIKYVAFDFDGYHKEDFLEEGHYFHPGPAYKNKDFVTFKSSTLFLLLRRKDFNKLKKVRD